MGEVTEKQAATARASRLASVLAVLVADNPGSAGKATIYAHAFVDYEIAEANIAKYGAVVYHPRTGAPIENPYLSIRKASSKLMLGIIGLRTDRVWTVVR